MAMIAKAPLPARLAIRAAALLAPFALIAACAQPSSQDDAPPADMPERNGTAEPVIPAEFKALGTEPFWALTATGLGTAHSLRFSTPENIDGTLVTIEDESAEGETRRVAGTLDGIPFTVALTVEPCSDGMSDRDYPFAARIAWGGETFRGCARPLDS